MSLLPIATILAPPAVAWAGDAAWPSLLMLGILAGLLALDDTALAQTWFSQPLPAGVLAGWFCGEPAAGMAIGLLLQLIKAGDLPVGQSFIGDAAVPVVAGTGAVVLGGHRLGLPFLDASQHALAFTGWVVLGVGLLSALGHWIIQTERRAHVLWMMEGHLTLRDGALSRIERLHFRCLLTTFLRGFLFGTLFLLVLLRLWLPAFDYLTPRLREAAAMLPLLLPGLGIGTLIDRFAGRRNWIWMGVASVGAFALARWAL